MPNLNTNLFIFILFSLIVFLGNGCSPFNEEKKFKGTLKGVSACMEKNKDQSELVSSSLIKERCIAKHQTFKDKIYSEDHLASVIVTKDFIKVSANSLDNNLGDYVITAVNLEGHFYDENGKYHSKSKWVKNLWVNPDKKYTAIVSIQNKFSQDQVDKITGSCNRIGPLEKKISCHGWNIVGYKVLKIILE